MRCRYSVLSTLYVCMLRTKPCIKVSQFWNFVSYYTSSNKTIFFIFFWWLSEYTQLIHSMGIAWVLSYQMRSFYTSFRRQNSKWWGEEETTTLGRYSRCATFRHFFWPKTLWRLNFAPSCLHNRKTRNNRHRHLVLTQLYAVKKIESLDTFITNTDLTIVF